MNAKREHNDVVMGQSNIKHKTFYEMRTLIERAYYLLGTRFSTVLQ